MDDVWCVCVCGCHVRDVPISQDDVISQQSASCADEFTHTHHTRPNIGMDTLLLYNARLCVSFMLLRLAAWLLLGGWWWVISSSTNNLWLGDMWRRQSRRHRFKLPQSFLTGLNYFAAKFVSVMMYYWRKNLQIRNQLTCPNIIPEPTLTQSQSSNLHICRICWIICISIYIYVLLCTIQPLAARKHTHTSLVGLCSPRCSTICSAQDLCVMCVRVFVI